MPYEVRKTDGKFCVFNTQTNENKGCSDTKSMAGDHLKALYAAEAEMAADEVLSLLDEDDDGNIFTYSDNMKEYGWEGPIVFENTLTGDNRMFKTNSINWQPETLPWAFRWQKQSGQGHAGSVPVGRVDSIQRREDGSIYGRGVVIPGLSSEATEYLNLLKTGVGGGVSVDGDSAQFEIQENEGGQPKVEFSSMRLRALSAVDIPAFNGARIHLVGQSVEASDEEVIDFGDESAQFVPKKNHMKMGWNFDDALVASAIPTFPSTEAFVEPQFDGPTALTVTRDGKVFGHLALFGTCHIGFPGTCVKPPKGSNYQYFHTGQIETAEGDLVDVGHLTFGIGHASMNGTARAAAEHYDNTNAVAADVRCGEDQFGIWVVGALRPHLTDDQIREFRAAPLSGDWRRIAGKLELVGALAVNTPGFPVPRVKALVASGETEALFTFLEEDDEEFVSDYEFQLRRNRKLDLAHRLGIFDSIEQLPNSLSTYELQMRFDKKIELAGKLDKVLNPDTTPNADGELPAPPSPPSVADLKKRAANYTAAQIKTDLGMLKEILDDPLEQLTATQRKQLQGLYDGFSKADLGALTASAVSTELDAVEEFYNKAHDKQGRFTSTGGSGGGGGGLSGEHNGHPFIKDPAAHNAHHAGSGGGGGGGGGGKGKGKGGHGGGDDISRQKSVISENTVKYKDAMVSAARYAATATLAYAAATHVGAAAGVAHLLLPGLIANPAGLVLLAGIAAATAIRRVGLAKAAHKSVSVAARNVRILEREKKLEAARAASKHARIVRT